MQTLEEQSIQRQKGRAALAAWDRAVRAWRADPHLPRDWAWHEETSQIGMNAVRVLACTFVPHFVNGVASGTGRPDASRLVVSPAGVSIGL